MRGCPDNHAIIMGALPGTSYDTKLKALVENAREFVSFYESLSGRIGKEGKGGKQEKEGNTTSETLAFLETLRDGNTLP
jgi:hypothetical protein